MDAYVVVETTEGGNHAYYCEFYRDLDEYVLRFDGGEMCFPKKNVVYIDITYME